MACAGYPELETFLPATDRIIAIGDIHGDLDMAKRCFKLAGLIDSQDQWIGGKTIVVQVGDQIDSCRPRPGHDCHNHLFSNDKAEDVSVIHFFDDMHKKAVDHGGAVYSLLGNHELLNVAGDFRYVSKANMDQFSYDGETNRQTAFAKGGKLAKHLACTRQSILVIGSNLFVHAGILPEMLQRLDKLQINERSKLKYINTAVRQWLLNTLPDSHDHQWIEYSKDSPFWTRVYGSITDKTPSSDKLCLGSLQVLRLLQLDSMIIGHTPHSNISVGCESIYRIDTGMSKAFPTANKARVLQISQDKDFQVLSE